MLKHLFCSKGSSEDTDDKTVLASRENMIHNAEILEALATNMNQRGRCGADPIDVICSMTVKFYEMHPLYTEVKKDFNLKGSFTRWLPASGAVCQSISLVEILAFHTIASFHARYVLFC